MDLTRFFGRITWRTRTVVGAVLIVIVLLAAFVYAMHSRGDAAADTTANQTPLVSVASVSSLAESGTSFSVIGTVQSETEASVLTQGAGEVTHVYKQLGDSVSAGAVIAELDNASQRAAVTQAQGAVAAAEASLSKVESGARTQQRTIAEASDASAKAAAGNAVASAYAAIEDTVTHTADPMFSNPNTTDPSIAFTSTESQLVVNAENERQQLAALLAKGQSAADGLGSTSDSAALHAAIAAAQSDVRETRDFFDTLIGALNAAVPSQSVSTTQIATWEAGASTARSTLTGTLSALTSADAALTTADETLSQTNEGAQPQDTAAAQAAVMQAQGGLAAAQAALEKTIVRAPISGTINAISITQGDYVSNFENVVTIANNHALEIVANVTEADAKRLTAGQPVTIDGSAAGTVTRIAPAIDPSTKSIQVKIGVTEGADALTNGESVTVTFPESETQAAASQGPATIPIIAAKILPTGPVVFTVSADDTLVAHPISFGPILGDRVTVTEGLTPDMAIVTDARGLFEGEKVEVATGSAPAATTTAQ
ncbi:MAG TPA: efflux RND transporter periplasmic adaptor subunit [Candidatus Paceibacterota bacterium]|nr:efflux RND transporter periplasmic adaptor subunit [Candidatus Paceibacterota bacterium]